MKTKSDKEKRLFAYIYKTVGLQLSDRAISYIASPEKLNKIRNSDLESLVCEVSPVVNYFSNSLSDTLELSEISHFNFSLMLRCKNKPYFSDLSSKELFNPKIHICKFIFQERDMFQESLYHQRIVGNMYSNELSIELLSSSGIVLESYGYKLDGYLPSILPLLRWEDFEKTRDITGWEQHNNCGYRDGWGYDFLCYSECGKPLIQNHLDVLFSPTNEPAYEKLLRWIIKVYAHRKEFKNKDLFW